MLDGIGYAGLMGEQKADAALGELVIEFPEDAGLPDLADIDELHASVETQDPPDPHSIRERWARLADIGAGG
jgi:hypothetical protein